MFLSSDLTARLPAHYLSDQGCELRRTLAANVELTRVIKRLIARPAVTLAYFLAIIYFLRFWRESSDRLWLLFCGRQTSGTVMRPFCAY